jgi:hypothetical protein
MAGFEGGADADCAMQKKRSIVREAFQIGAAWGERPWDV